MFIFVLEFVLERDAKYCRKVPGEDEAKKQEELLVDGAPRRVTCSKIDGLSKVRSCSKDHQ